MSTDARRFSGAVHKDTLDSNGIAKDYVTARSCTKPWSIFDIVPAVCSSRSKK